MAYNVVLVLLLAGIFPSLFASEVCKNPIRTAVASLVGFDVRDFDTRSGESIICAYQIL